jgi:signal transduction histidine kinase
MSREDEDRARAITEAVEAERQLLAQTLHDSVCQTLSALVLQARVVERRLAKTNPEAAGDWTRFGASLQYAVRELQEVMRSLRPENSEPDEPPGI